MCPAVQAYLGRSGAYFFPEKAVMLSHYSKSDQHFLVKHLAVKSQTLVLQLPNKRVQSAFLIQQPLILKSFPSLKELLMLRGSRVAWSLHRWRVHLCPEESKLLGTKEPV